MGNCHPKKSTSLKPPIIPNVVGMDALEARNDLEELNPGYDVLLITDQMIIESTFYFYRIMIYHNPSTMKVTKQPEIG